VPKANNKNTMTPTMTPILFLLGFFSSNEGALEGGSNLAEFADGSSGGEITGVLALKFSGGYIGA